jgi:hypothetical protein
MGKHGITLYKRTHFIAIAIFAILVATATAAIAMIHQHTEALASSAPTIGRFVVTPTRICFVEAGHLAAIGKDCGTQ